MNREIKWIDINDQLPTNEYTVLIWGCYTRDCPHRVREAHYYKRGKNYEFRSMDGIKSKFVTHWAKMPDGPELLTQ